MASVVRMRRLISLLLVLGLVVAACSPGSDDGSESTSTSDGSSEQTTTTAAGDDSTTTSEAAAPTTTQASSSQGSSCVEGSWLLSTETFVELMESAMTGTELDTAVVTPADGTYIVTFDSGGSFMGVRDEWGFSVVSPDGTFHIRMSGTENGTWSADDTTITVTVDSSDVTVSSSAEVDGQTIDIPNSPVDVPDALAESSAYVCDGDTLTVTNEEFTFTLDRV